MNNLNWKSISVDKDVDTLRRESLTEDAIIRDANNWKLGSKTKHWDKHTEYVTNPYERSNLDSYISKLSLTESKEAEKEETSVIKDAVAKQLQEAYVLHNEDGYYCEEDDAFTCDKEHAKKFTSEEEAKDFIYDYIEDNSALMNRRKDWVDAVADSIDIEKLEESELHDEVARALDCVKSADDFTAYARAVATDPGAYGVESDEVAEEMDRAAANITIQLDKAERALDWAEKELRESNIPENFHIEGDYLYDEDEKIGMFWHGLHDEDFGLVVMPEYEQYKDDLFTLAMKYFTQCFNGHADWGYGPWVEFEDISEELKESCSNCDSEEDGYNDPITGELLCSDCYANKCEELKEASTKDEDKITFPGGDLHSRMCEWCYSTADYYDLQDACEVDETPEEMIWNMSDVELADAIRYTLDNEEAIWYIYADDDTETSTAREDGEKLLREYEEDRYTDDYEGYLNYCKDTNGDPMPKEEWMKVTGIRESNEYFDRNKDSVYVARRVRDQKGKEDYADWQKEYLGSKRRARWVNSPLYAKKFKNEEEAQKYLDDNGKDDYYESDLKESNVEELSNKEVYLVVNKLTNEYLVDQIDHFDFSNNILKAETFNSYQEAEEALDKYIEEAIKYNALEDADPEEEIRQTRFSIVSKSLKDLFKVRESKMRESDFNSETDELRYLFDKEQCCPLDKEEMYRLQDLIQKYGRPDDMDFVDAPEFDLREVADYIMDVKDQLDSEDDLIFEISDYFGISEDLAKDWYERYENSSLYRGPFYESKMKEDFWNPSKIFDAFCEEVESPSNWNELSKEEREDALRPEIEAFINKHLNDLNRFNIAALLEDLTDNNYHTERRVFVDLLKKMNLDESKKSDFKSLMKHMCEKIKKSERLNEKLEPCTDFEDIKKAAEEDPELKKFMNTPLKDLPENYKYLIGRDSWEDMKDVTPAEYMEFFYKMYPFFTKIVSKDNNELLGWIACHVYGPSITDIKMFSFKPEIQNITFMRDLKDFFNTIVDEYRMIRWTADRDNPFIKHYYKAVEMFNGEAVEEKDSTVVFIIDNFKKKHDNLEEASRPGALVDGYWKKNPEATEEDVIEYLMNFKYDRDRASEIVRNFKKMNESAIDSFVVFNTLSRVIVDVCKTAETAKLKAGSYNAYTNSSKFIALPFTAVRNTEYTFSKDLLDKICDRLAERSVWSKKNDVQFFVIKRLTDHKYYAKEAFGLSDSEAEWVEGLDNAEAYDDKLDADDVLEDMINELVDPMLHRFSTSDKKVEEYINKYDDELSKYEIIGIKADHFHEKKLKESKEKDIKVDFAIPVNERGRIKANDAKQLLKYLANNKLLKLDRAYFVTDINNNTTCWDLQRDEFSGYKFDCEVTETPEGEEVDVYHCLTFDKNNGKLTNFEWEAYKV